MWASRERNRSAKCGGILYTYVEYKSRILSWSSFVAGHRVSICTWYFQVEVVRRHKLHHPKQIVIVVPLLPAKRQLFSESSVGKGG
jgi:hypothetical protein